MRKPEWEWFLWWSRRLYASAGLPLLLAGVFLTAAMGIYAAMADIRAETHRLQLQSSEMKITVRPPTDVNKNNARLAAFFNVLPERQATPDILQALFALGAKKGVVLAQGDYRIDREENGMLRCHIRFPVSGETGKLEGFIWDALRAFPALALEGVMFQRQSPAESEGEAEIRFILFMKPDNSSAPALALSAHE